MSSTQREARVLLLNGRDWVYLLSLLIPFVVYNLALKFATIASVPGLVPTFDLMYPDVFFNLGYALFWIGLFTLVHSTSRRPLRWVVVFLFHVMTILVVIVTTSAHQYFQETGTTLDYSIIALWIVRPGEVGPVLAGSVPLSSWVLLFSVLLYGAFGPLLVAHAVGLRRGQSQRLQSARPEEASLLGSIELWLPSVGLLLLALGFGSLSLLIGARPTDNPSGVTVGLVRDPFVNMVLTGINEATSSEEDSSDSGSAAAAEQNVEHPAAYASLAQTSSTEKRNVVLIHLESTRAQSVTPYNKDLETTPFLDELAQNSLLVERAYTTVPHTSKASVSVNCGIFPHLVQPTTEAKPSGLPVPCLAGLLKEQGYSTVFFQSSTEDFENFGELVKNFGYEEYYPLESMDMEGFERSNYFGYEDDIMLKPSQEWLQQHEDTPFLAEYLTGTGHHDYQCLGLRYGDEDFSNDEPLNSYLNCLRYQDKFLQNLFDQYKRLGLYDNSIFVIYGDHGEGFGEHGRFQHDDTIYEEGLRVPLIIHAPGLLKGAVRAEGLSNHTDILPTVLELLGYEVKDGQYPGYSLLHQLPEDRTLMFNCFHEDQCLASLKASEKYIYHYDNQPDEFFDLSEDPLEQEDLANEESKEELDERREDLLAWHAKINADYTDRAAQ
jgi:lipoteichoic acid synthase